MIWEKTKHIYPYEKKSSHITKNVKKMIVDENEKRSVRCT